MHYFEDQVPIHRGPVDILQFDRWTWRAIDPTDMSTDKALDIRCSRQCFHQRHLPLTPMIHWVTRRVASFMVCSLRDIATIDGHGMSRDKRGSIGAEPHYSFSDFLWMPHPSDGFTGE